MESWIGELRGIEAYFLIWRLTFCTLFSSKEIRGLRCKQHCHRLAREFWTTKTADRWQKHQKIMNSYNYIFFFKMMKRHAGVQNCVLCLTLSWTSLDMTVLAFTTSMHIDPSRSDSKPFQPSVWDVQLRKNAKVAKNYNLRDQRYSTTKACNYLANSARMMRLWDTYIMQTNKFCSSLAKSERNSPWFATKDRSVLAHSQRPSGRAIPPISDPEYLRYFEIFICRFDSLRHIRHTKKRHLRFFLPE